MKIVNIVLALGTAIIVGALINLGIAAFHPEPVAPEYNLIVKATMPYPVPCAVGDTVCNKELKTYNAEQQRQQDIYNAQEQAYEGQMKVYNSDLFIIANLAGILVFALAFWLLFTTAIAARGVPIGVMMAGLWGIIYGYARGWGSVNDQLKFFVGLIVAVLVIGGSVWLIQRNAKTNNA